VTRRAAAGVRQHLGTARYRDTDVHCTPLGYQRQQLDTGSEVVPAASTGLTSRLARCDGVEAAFHGKLGDSLLALSGVRAAAEWLALDRGRPVACTASGPHAPLIERTALTTRAATSPPGGARAVVTDPGAAAASQSAPATLVLDPAVPPCWSSDGRAHPDLPARHYLALERRLGSRLPATTPFAPLLYARGNPLVEQLDQQGWLAPPTIAVITATSWPTLKDYGLDRYLEAADRLAHHLDTDIRVLHITGTDTPEPGAHAEQAHGRLRLLPMPGLPAIDLVDLLPQTDLVLGNDTGLTHLAALARTPSGTGPHVIGLYARHSHSKWHTGLPHHHALATEASEQMHQGDLCPVRDHLTQHDGTDLAAITPATVANLAATLLGATR
jgi:hypothetical protein